MKRFFVALGSNTEPERHLQRALGLLEQRYGRLTVSPVYRNAAVGFDGEDFLNLVAAFDTDEPPGAVSRHLRHIESECGRDRSLPKFGPRTLDLDLLLVGGDVLDIEGKHIPRDEILKFAFVLKPLADIAPHMAHPETGRRFADHWEAFDASAHRLTPVPLSANGDRK